VTAAAAAALFLAAPGPGTAGDLTSPTSVPAGCPLPLAVQTSLLNSAFSEPLYGGPLKSERVRTIEDFNNRLFGLFIPAELLNDSYIRTAILDQRLECIDAPDCKYEALGVDYVVAGWEYTAYAYYRAAETEAGKRAVVVIPGSGDNQSTAIYLNDARNYHYNIAELIRHDWDTYVCVKPNEDFLAVHNGGAKLSRDYMVAHLMNLGGSYSSRFIVDTMAIVKHLRALYGKVVVIGLSQGGQAALYNALQSKPDGAFIASGYSVLQEALSRAELDQIIVPGMVDYMTNEDIFEGIRDSRTRFVFTWGRQERGTYGVEAEYNCTANFFLPLGNVKCVVHDGGHVFPGPAVTEFLDSIRSAPSGADLDVALRQNAPNPFSSSTWISFAVKTEGRVRLEIFDAEGRLVRLLVDEELIPDLYVREWDGRDSHGRPMPSGAYFYRLVAPDRSISKKMTLAR
jgi:predicted esterase